MQTPVAETTRRLTFDSSPRGDVISEPKRTLGPAQHHQSLFAKY